MSLLAPTHHRPKTPPTTPTMPVLKDHYYRLASELPKERIDAATALLRELAAANSTADWDYAFSRLTKGLTSTRQSAKFGFSMALTELVRELIPRDDYPLTVNSFLDELTQASEPKASMKGKELRAVLFGRLFGLQALANSGVLQKAEKESVSRFVDALVELSSIKSWLRETAMFTLCQFLQLYASEAHFDEVALHALQVVNDAGLNLSTEGVAVYLCVPKGLRPQLAAKIDSPKASWKNGDPLSRGNLPILAKALKDMDVADPEEDESTKNSKQKGSWLPRLPFVWDLIFAAFQNDSDTEDVEPQQKKRKKSSKASKKLKKSDDEISLKEFWQVVVDESLFADKSSHERKYWGFEIFAKFLSATTSANVPVLFTKNFLRCLVNHSSQNNRLLHKISVKTLNIIVQAAKDDHTKSPVFLESLTNEKQGGTWNFDIATKSKTVDSLIGVLSVQKENLNEAEAEITASDLKTVLLAKFKDALEELDDTDAPKKATDNVQKWILDKLLVLFRSTKAIQEKLSTKWLDEILKFLIQHAFFKTIGSNTVSSNVRQLMLDRMNSFLGELISVKRKDSSWPAYCLKYIEKFERQPEKYTLILDFDEELLTVKEECVELLDSIKTLLKGSQGAGEKHEQLRCFELLFAMVLIQFYAGDEEAVSVLGELRLCFESAFSDEEDDEQVDTAVVLTEIILSFVSRKSTLLKKLSLIVWENFLCSSSEEGKTKLNSASLQLLFDVLETKENMEGQQKLFEGEGEFVAEGEEEEEKEEDMSEDEEEEDEDEDENDDDEEDDDEDNDEASTSVNEVEKETTLKLAKALGLPTGVSGEVKFDELDSFEGDDSSYESDSMDDEQMMAMDDQLSRIFKERHDALSHINTGNVRKNEVLDAREQMIFFKNRVLDLLEAAVKAQPNSHLNLSMLKPLVFLINLTLDKNVGVKAHKLLKTRISKTRVSEKAFAREFPSEKEQTVYKESLISLMEWFQHQASATKLSNQAHSLACSQSCIIVAKNLVQLDSAYMGRVVDIYSSALREWATDLASRTQPLMFFDFINWLNTKRTA